MKKCTDDKSWTTLEVANALTPPLKAIDKCDALAAEHAKMLEAAKAQDAMKADISRYYNEYKFANALKAADAKSATVCP